MYKINDNNKIIFGGEEIITTEELLKAVELTNEELRTVLPESLHNFQGKAGEYLIRNLEKTTRGNVHRNPNSIGYPDICLTNNAERRGYFYDYTKTRVVRGHMMIEPLPGVGTKIFSGYKYGGPEVKTTAGIVKKTPDGLYFGDQRVNYVIDISVDAHNTCTREMFLVMYDFIDEYPVITGVFYSNEIVESDWKPIKNTVKIDTRGAGTIFTPMLKSGIEKIKKGWLLIHDDEKYLEMFSKIGVII